VRRPALALLGLTGGLGCGSEAPVPDAPTWARDVQPILRANCFQCHGASADYLSGTMRWDVFDLDEPPYKQMGFAPVFEDLVQANGEKMRVATFFGGKDPGLSRLMNDYASPDASGLRMPPPPALPLSAREQTVLKRWADRLTQGPVQAPAQLKGSHDLNHKPTIGWLQPRTRFEVRDEDGDQVLGRLDCHGVEVRILHSGGLDLPVGAQTPCTGNLYDGYEEQSVTLE
jgi:hypothetical protein